MIRKQSKNNLLICLEAFAGLILIVSILLILFTTLLPFNFVFPENLSVEFIIDRLTRHSSWTDLFSNLLLFIPFGFALAALCDRYQLDPSKSIGVVVLFSLILSISAEFLQVFLPSRAPTSVDLLSNTISGFLGSWIFYAIRNQLERTPTTVLMTLYQNIKPLLYFRSLMLILVGYVVIISCFLWHLQTATQLNNWEESFPLIISNELTENRAWEGQVSQVCIANTAASKAQASLLLSDIQSCDPLADSLIANYNLQTIQTTYRDRSGNLPNLEWIETPSAQVNEKGVFLGKNQGLKTLEPVNFLTDKIQQTSAFTVSTQVTTSNLTQDGPARILTISKDLMSRNLTIAQSGSDLRVRLRNPITGENGLKPEIQVFDVFSEPKTHNMVITYTGSELQIYLDQVENFYRIEFTPEAALFWSIFSSISEKMPLNPRNNLLYRLLYHGLIFIPIGLILTLILSLFRGNASFYFLLIFGGVLLPIFLIEGVLASTLNGAWNWGNVGLDIAIVVIVVFGVKLSTGLKGRLA
ncbi:MAG: VanZ family protein [Cyanobacteria bacterium J06592_8]